MLESTNDAEITVNVKIDGEEYEYPVGITPEAIDDAWETEWLRNHLVRVIGDRAVELLMMTPTERARASVVTYSPNTASEPTSANESSGRKPDGTGPST